MFDPPEANFVLFATAFLSCFNFKNYQKYPKIIKNSLFFDQIGWISIMLTIYWIITLKNDHFMIYFEFLAVYGSTVAKCYHPDFWNVEFWHFRWPFSGYHIQVTNQENYPKLPIFCQKWSKLAKILPKIDIFWSKTPFCDQILWINVKKIRKYLEIFHCWVQKFQKMGNFGPK